MTNTELISAVLEAPADPRDAAAARALVNIKPETYAKQVFEPYKKQLTAAVRAAAKTPEFNIQTTAGLEVAKQLRASFRTIRIGAENMRKERKAPIIQIGKLLDTRYKELEADITPHEDKFDAMIKAEEARKEQIKAEEVARERARVEQIENRLRVLRGIPALHLQSSAADINQAIERNSILVLDPDEFEEYHEAAQAALDGALVELQRMHRIAVERETEAARVQAERAELARLRHDAAVADRQRQAAADEQARRIAALEAQLAAATAPKAALVPAPEYITADGELGDIQSSIQLVVDAERAEDTQYHGADADAALDVVDADFLEVSPAGNSFALHVPAVDFEPMEDRPADFVPPKGHIVALLAHYYGATSAEVEQWLTNYFTTI